ncbi:MAG: hypothetical protein ISS56_00115 [Anaerolineae bacterium]|nr:hypothetical protein [Anaerolineae bacterium]
MVKRTELALKNKDFCDGFRNYNDIGELTVANDWHAWWREGEDHQEPGYLHRPDYEPEDGRRFGYRRIRTGDFAQKLFTTFSTHEAGIYQQVSGVSVGKQVTFSAWVQVWSSKHDNIEQSKENGCYKTCVGIDPYGGTDPRAPQVIWGELTEEYDVWGQRTVSVEAVSDTITVFLRGTVQWRVKHNDSYWDEARLYAEPMLKTGGDYLLLPEGAGAEWYQAAVPYLAEFGISAGKRRQDAGLLGGVIVAINPTEGLLSEMEELELGVEVILAATPVELSTALAERIEDGHHLAQPPPSDVDYILMSPSAGRSWYAALLHYLMRFGPSSGRSVQSALKNKGFVTAINPDPEVLARLQGDQDVLLDVIEAASPEALLEILQKRIVTGRRLR